MGGYVRRFADAIMVLPSLDRRNVGYYVLNPINRL